MTGVPDAGVGLAALVRDVPDFPKAGIGFKDITPLLGDPEALANAIHALGDPYAKLRVTKVVGIEARGFLLATPVALALGAGFVPVRKAGKLPWQVEREEYALEYGTDLLEIHADAVEPGERVLVIDDVLATGGTASATVRLLERIGAEVVGLAFLIELGFLHGRDQLPDRAITSLITFD